MSAGAVASPQLLMLSGIGPAEHLQEHGIATVSDLPGVGQNLRDHPNFQIAWFTKSNVELNAFGPRAQLLMRYTATGSDLENDMIVYFSSVSSERSDRGGKRSEAFGIGATLGINLAKGKGELRLNSADCHDQPYIDFNYLEEAEDRRRVRDGVRMLVGLEKHPKMAELIDRRKTPVDADLKSDAAIDDWARREVITGQHISCTAKMGPASDPMAVVDQFGKVYGVDGLRVADASIMPDCIRANTNNTVMVMGERITDFIKAGD
jgi:choline dehydrogenase-like flavoprotein